MPLQDEDLARRAAAGDHASFAELYDRYERRAYNLCYRITGSADDAADATQETFLKVLERLPQLRDRELNFAAYVMTAARNASYDAIERRKRSTPTSEFPEVPLADDHELPERVALREAHQEQIRLANESLPARQREVLALRELEDLSYGEVAQIMGMNQNSVAQLISRARINLRDGLRQTALGSVASASPQCDRALPLLARHQDGLLEDPWLVEHLMECGACRVRLEAMEEAAVAYRQWLLLVPALWLREETAEAAERVNGGWNRAPGRRMRVLAGAGAALVLLLALAFVTADGAQSPTRAPVADDPVVRTAHDIAEPVERRAKKKPPVHVKTAKKKAPRKVQPAGAQPEPAAAPASEPVVTAQVVPAPEPVAPKARPRREREPVKTVVPDPPPPVQQDPVQVVTTTPVPPEPTPGGTTQTPPCQSTSAAGCPPPRPPVVTCRTCTIVAPPPPPRRPLRLVDPNSINRTP
jgi:RNA polymerase sigma factor (sigma-70 family)